MRAFHRAGDRLEEAVPVGLDQVGMGGEGALALGHHLGEPAAPIVLAVPFLGDDMRAEPVELGLIGDELPANR